MVPVAEHGLAGLLQLLANLVLVAVIEPVALVAQPDADRDRQPEGMGLIEDLAGIVCRPGANGIRTGGRQLLERTGAACALDEIGLATAQELPALLGLVKFDWYGLGHHAPAK